jgi:hypothetical protein
MKKAIIDNPEWALRYGEAFLKSLDARIAANGTIPRKNVPTIYNDSMGSQIVKIGQSAQGTGAGARREISPKSNHL